MLWRTNIFGVISHIILAYLEVDCFTDLRIQVLLPTILDSVDGEAV